DLLISLVTSVVHHQGDFLPGVGFVDLPDKFADRLGVDRSGASHTDEIMIACLDRTENAIPLPPASRSHNDPGKGPDHPKEGAHHEVDGINEKNPPLSLPSLFQPGQELVAEEVELHLWVGLARHRCALLILH